MKEQEGDKMLGIQTAGIQQGFHDSLHYNRYEPTPYELLERLFNTVNLVPDDRVVDFGCGKGRLNFYLHHRFAVSTVGVEMDAGFIDEALKNRDSYERRHPSAKGRIEFRCCLAEEYKVHPKDNMFYFFNPFSAQIFMKVIRNILRSVEKRPRKVELILFYPSHDYIEFLDRRTAFELVDEITLPRIEKDGGERFLVYRLY